MKMNILQKVIGKLNQEHCFKPIDAISNREVRALISVLQEFIDENKQSEQHIKDS